MNSMLRWVGTFGMGLATVLAGASAQAQEVAVGVEQPAAPQVAVQAEVTVEEPAAPPMVQVQPAAQGEWVYTEAYGWVWVPAGSSAYASGAEPYVYVYTPVYGWTWYVSPWGWGPYYRGAWERSAWGWSYGPRVWGGRSWATPRGYVAPPRPGAPAAPRVYAAPRAGYAAPHAGAGYVAPRAGEVVVP